MFIYLLSTLYFFRFLLLLLQGYTCLHQINQMRKDTLDQNSQRISEAKNEGETWKVVNEILKLNIVTKITIRTPEGEQSDEIIVANLMTATDYKFLVTVSIRMLPDSGTWPLIRSEPLLPCQQRNQLFKSMWRHFRLNSRPTEEGTSVSQRI